MMMMIMRRRQGTKQTEGMSEQGERKEKKEKKRERDSIYALSLNL
jgi:hypothetical protein